MKVFFSGEGRGECQLRKSSYLLNDLSNFDEIFRKNATFDNNKSRKKAGFPPRSRKHIFEKNKGGEVKLTPPSPSLFRVNTTVEVLQCLSIELIP